LIYFPVEKVTDDMEAEKPTPTQHDIPTTIDDTTAKDDDITTEIDDITPATENQHQQQQQTTEQVEIVENERNNEPQGG